MIREYVNAITGVFAKRRRVRIDPTAIIHPTALIGEDPQNYLWRHGWQSLQTNGGIYIGPGVRIGPYTTIMCGVLGDTLIGPGARIGHHVNIGHDVEIGEDTIVIAGALIAGWVRVGHRVRIDMGACIKNGVTIGEGARVGMGAVVLTNIGPGQTWVGNPARPI